jgi:hypothetical protein
MAGRFEASKLIRLPSDPAVTKGPDVHHLSEWQRDRRAKVKRSKRRVSIMSALATGWLPWGVEWHPSLTLCWDYSDKTLKPISPEFILCCGHVMRVPEAQTFVDHGLLTIGKDQHGKDGLVITDAGRAWLQGNY